MSYLQTYEAAIELGWTPKPDDLDGWTERLVRWQIVEAFDIDARCEAIGRPRPPGSASLQVGPDDLQWLVVVDPEALEMALERHEQDAARAKPVPEEIERMEMAFGWLLIVRDSDWDGYFALKNWARLKAREQSMRRFCKRNGIGQGTFRARSERALRAICSRLLADERATC